MSIAFCTHCSDDWFYDGGCSKLLATAKYFHPDIPFYVFGNLELSQLSKKYGGQLSWDIMNPIVSLEIAKMHDRVIHFDADSIILGQLDSLLHFDTDVVGVRNNNDFGTASKFTDKPVTINNCLPSEYMNAGLIGSKTIKFWEYWIQKNFQLARSMPYAEQDVMNLIIQEGKFSFSCLDSVEKDVHYGISCHFGDKTFWDSSKLIKKVESDFMLKNKKVKVYHQAGGHQYFPKLNLDNLFSKETSLSIQEIINNSSCSYEKVIL
jgi:hypothetical protein